MASNSTTASSSLVGPINRIFAYLQIAQKNGTFTLMQSADVYEQIKKIKWFFQQNASNSKNAVENPQPILSEDKESIVVSKKNVSFA